MLPGRVSLVDGFNSAAAHAENGDAAESREARGRVAKIPRMGHRDSPIQYERAITPARPALRRLGLARRAEYRAVAASRRRANRARSRLRWPSPRPRRS